MFLLVLLTTLGLLLLIRAPIFVALGLSTTLTVLTLTDIPPVVIVQRSVVGIDALPLLAAPLFVLAGNVMLDGGISNRLILFIDGLLGFSRLRLAYVNVFGSLFFGGISGSAVADSAAVGSVLIPEMSEQGYPRGYSAGLTAASSSLGIVIPPSIPMILAGSVANVSVGQLFIGGYGPGLLIACSLMAVAFAQGRTFPLATVRDKVTLRRIARSFRAAFFPLLFPFIVMGGILLGVFTATEASAVAVVYGLFMSMIIYRKTGLRDLWRVLAEAAEFTAVLFAIVATAQAFGWVLTIAGVPRSIAEFMLGTLQDPVLVVLAILVLVLLVGAFMETIPIILVLYPLLDPIARAIGMDPVHFGVMFVTALAIGLLTPPYGILLFVNSRIAGIPSRQMMRSVVPYVGVLLVDLVLIAFVPAISLFLLPR